MKSKVDIAEIYLWSNKVGAVGWDNETNVATFEFEKKFLESIYDIAPLWMPLEEARRGVTKFSFPDINKLTYKGLPGLLADALPDNYGNKIIDIWLARQGRSPKDFSPVERLCYMGNRSMGALVFKPVIRTSMDKSVLIDIGELVDLAQRIVNNRSALATDYNDDKSKAITDIISVATSAGGNRSKAVIAINKKTKQIRSGQIDVPKDFTHWILKFDGVKDEALGDPKGYGLIEYVYYKMALSAGINMNECALLKENGRSHFMTKRFDRLNHNEKIHMQTLCAIAHFDYNAPGSHSYEQAFQVMRELKLPYPDMEQLYRRMVFNVAARNQDDHTKNISFLMDKSGEWRLSPAYDIIYAYNASQGFTNKHQMQVNGKRDGFQREDLILVGDNNGIKNCKKIIEETLESILKWPQLAKNEGLSKDKISKIKKMHRFI
ncbi:type II toxin-antitoxin system HipA family toxin [Candidatus Omnitrophota bacterium]